MVTLITGKLWQRNDRFYGIAIWTFVITNFFYGAVLLIDMIIHYYTIYRKFTVKTAQSVSLMRLSILIFCYSNYH